MQAIDEWVPGRGAVLRLHLVDGAGPGGPTVVVLHGLGTAVDVLREAAPGRDPYAALAAEGLNVVGMDWPGHGRSGGRRGHLTYPIAMDAVATTLDAAARWGGPLALFGTGLGGALAFYAALQEERVRAVVCHEVLDLRDIAPSLGRRRQRLLLPLAGALRRVLAGGAQRRVPLPLDVLIPRPDRAEDSALERSMARHPQAVRSYDLEALGSILLQPEDKPSVAAQTTPTLVLVGAGDRVLGPAVARSVLAEVDAPSALWVVDGAGHQVLLEHGERVVPRIATWIRETLGS